MKDNTLPDFHTIEFKILLGLSVYTQPFDIKAAYDDLQHLQLSRYAFYLRFFNLEFENYIKVVRHADKANLYKTLYELTISGKVLVGRYKSTIV